MALEVTAIVLWLANHSVLLSRFGRGDDFDPHVFLVPGYATVGAVIAARQRNRIGWLFLAFGLAAAVLVFASAYFLRGPLSRPGRRRDWQTARDALEQLAGWGRHREDRDYRHADRDRPGRTVGRDLGHQERDGR